MGIVVSHQLNSMLHRDLMLSHEVTDLLVLFFDLSSFGGFLPPGGAFSRLWRVSLLSRVALVVG